MEWVRIAEPIAYEIGLKPWEFEQLQPGEFMLMLEAENRRQREQDYRAAYFLSYIIAPYLKKGSSLSLDDIVNPLWMGAEEIQENKQRKIQSDKENDREILEKEFGWALGGD